MGGWIPHTSNAMHRKYINRVLCNFEDIEIIIFSTLSLISGAGCGPKILKKYPDVLLSNIYVTHHHKRDRMGRLSIFRTA